MKRQKLLRVMKILPFAVLAIVLIGFVIMGLWNWLMPALFGLKPIGYWQAWGLLILCKILFGGLHGGHRGRWHPRMVANMTPEERERFRQAFEQRWGRATPPDATTGA